MIVVDGQSIWLCYYPMRSGNKRFHGAWSLYGHVHGKLQKEDEHNLHVLTRDVGVDACNYKPVRFEELKEYMAPRVVWFEGWKERVKNRNFE